MEIHTFMSWGTKQKQSGYRKTKAFIFIKKTVYGEWERGQAMPTIREIMTMELCLLPAATRQI
jgi:hypothetical protein